MGKTDVTLWGFLSTAFRKEIDRRAITVVDNQDNTYSLSVTGPASGSHVQVRGGLTDRSGQIGVGSVAQSVMDANVNRKYMFIENVSDADLWINFNTDANEDQPSLKIVASGSFVMESTFISTDSVSIIGAMVSQSYTAKEA